MMKLLKQFAFKLLSYYYILRGRKPLALGYNQYKILKITEILKINDFYKQLGGEGYGFDLDERVVEYPWLFSLMPEGPGNLLDAGSAMNYDYVLGHPKLSDKNIHIFTLAPEKRAYWRNGISYIYGDLKKTCLKDNYFDFVVCLSTLEHVGMDNTRYSKDKNNDEKAFNDYEHVISEIRRILKPGGRLFVSVPFGMYANNKWLQVFDGAMIEKVKKIFGPEKVEEFYFRHEGSWRKSTHEECSGCSFVEVKSGAARKEFPVIGAEAVACLMLVK